MLHLTKRNPGALVAIAVAVAIAAAPRPVQAQGGDITRGVLLGLVGGYSVDQYMHHQGLFQPQTEVSAPVYAPQPTAPVYYQPSGPTAAAYSQASPDSRAFNSEDRQVRIAIQYNLMQSGFYNGALDGVWGPATEDAVFHYARSHDQVAMLATEDDARQLFAAILH